MVSRLGQQDGHWCWVVPALVLPSGILQTPMDGALQQESRALPCLWSIPLPLGLREPGLGLPHQEFTSAPKNKNNKIKIHLFLKENSRLSFPSWRVGDGCFVIAPGLLLKTSWSDFYQRLNRNSPKDWLWGD